MFVLLIMTDLFGVLTQGSPFVAPPVPVLLFGLFVIAERTIAWVREKFSRTVLFVEKDRVVLQKNLFNLKKEVETRLSPTARAALVEGNSENDVTEFLIEIPGTPQKFRFGKSLAETEKEWLADRINEFLSSLSETSESDASRNDFPREDSEAPQDLADFSRISEEDQPVTSPKAGPSYLNASDQRCDRTIQIERDTSELLQFRMPMCSSSIGTWVTFGFCLVFCCLWCLPLFRDLDLGNPAPAVMSQVVEIVMSTPVFHWMGVLLPLGIGSAISFGTLTVTLDRDSLSCRWSIGCWGWTQSMPTGDITRVSVNDGKTRTDGGTCIHKTDQQHERICKAWSGDRELYLTSSYDVRTNQQVESLVRAKLRDFGMQMPES
ncbi:MAG: hypothetical protein JSS02_31395 [Planctomycetes bacterium]|nr:hypothetical protein [Planctomycetota bacterium]